MLFGFGKKKKEEDLAGNSVSTENAEEIETVQNTGNTESAETAQSPGITEGMDDTDVPEEEEPFNETESSEEADALGEDNIPDSINAFKENNTTENCESDESSDSVKEKTGFFSRLKEGLTKTRNNIVSGIDGVFGGFSKIDEDFYEELEEILIMGDIGVHATEEIIESLKHKVKENHISKPEDCKALLIQSIKDQMQCGETAYDFEHKQSVVFVIGVNGVGKTTSIGKLASILKSQGRHVILAAADTFRAAAGDQLAEWANRSGVEMIGGVEGADPASVIFDGVNAAKARKADILLCDTAGRLHNKKNLMEELKKMNRIIDREFPDAHRENLIVLDGTTGQNALMQAREFQEAADLTGIILTKMDGTAKGGIAVAIQSELGIPVKYIGVGEKIEDLQKFDADSFVDALFDVEIIDSIDINNGEDLNAQE